MNHKSDQAATPKLYDKLLQLWDEAANEYSIAQTFYRQIDSKVTQITPHIIRSWWLLVLLEASRKGNLVYLGIPNSYPAFHAQIPCEIIDLIPAKRLTKWQKDLKTTFIAATNWSHNKDSLQLESLDKIIEQQLKDLGMAVRLMRRKIDRQFNRNFFAILKSNAEPILALVITVTFIAYLILSIALGSYSPSSWGWVTTRDFKVKNNAIFFGKFGIDRASDGTALSIGGKTFEKGFGTHAVSRTILRFHKEFSSFSGACGVDDGGGRGIKKRGSIVCQIKAGEHLLFSSEILRGGDQAVKFNIPIRGISELTLIATNGGDNNRSDHANWVNLQAY